MLSSNERDLGDSIGELVWCNCPVKKSGWGECTATVDADSDCSNSSLLPFWFLIISACFLVSILNQKSTGLKEWFERFIFAFGNA